MTCDELQAEFSRALDEGGSLAPYERHVAACSECSDFADAALELASRYRAQVLRGIDRLRCPSPTLVPRGPGVRRLLPLAAAILVLVSVPLRPAPPPERPVPTAAAHVPLFDGMHLVPEDLGLAVAVDPPLPRRLDHDLPPLLEGDPSVLLPPDLRF
ncbi:MAG: hypothetical protein JO332_00775 [Planctomycetaceae bacterium]|nr:hypothetical protein [Planctomycetaceae bacterium]